MNLGMYLEINCQQIKKRKISYIYIYIYFVLFFTFPSFSLYYMMVKIQISKIDLDSIQIPYFHLTSLVATPIRESLRRPCDGGDGRMLGADKMTQARSKKCNPTRQTRGRWRSLITSIEKVEVKRKIYNADHMLHAEKDKQRISTNQIDQEGE